MFHVKHARYIGRSMASTTLVSRETLCIRAWSDLHGRTLVTGATEQRPGNARLFADAEVAEDHVQDILDVHSPRQAAKRTSGEAQLLGQQILA
jgi:hypothetical protein